MRILFVSVTLLLLAPVHSQNATVSDEKKEATSAEKENSTENYDVFLEERLHDSDAKETEISPVDALSKLVNKAALEKVKNNTVSRQFGQSASAMTAAVMMGAPLLAGALFAGSRAPDDSEPRPGRGNGPRPGRGKNTRRYGSGVPIRYGGGNQLDRDGEDDNSWQTLFQRTVGNLRNTASYIEDQMFGGLDGASDSGVEMTSPRVPVSNFREMLPPKPNNVLPISRLSQPLANAIPGRTQELTVQVPYIRGKPLMNSVPVLSPGNANTQYNSVDRKYPTNNLNPPRDRIIYPFTEDILKRFPIQRSPIDRQNPVYRPLPRMNVPADSALQYDPKTGWKPVTNNQRNDNVPRSNARNGVQRTTGKMIQHHQPQLQPNERNHQRNEANRRHFNRFKQKPTYSRPDSNIGTNHHSNHFQISHTKHSSPNHNIRPHNLMSNFVSNNLQSNVLHTDSNLQRHGPGPVSWISRIKQEDVLNNLPGSIKNFTTNFKVFSDNDVRVHNRDHSFTHPSHQSSKNDNIHIPKPVRVVENFKPTERREHYKIQQEPNSERVKRIVINPGRNSPDYRRTVRKSTDYLASKRNSSRDENYPIYRDHFVNHPNIPPVKIKELSKEKDTAIRGGFPKTQNHFNNEKISKNNAYHDNPYEDEIKWYIETLDDNTGDLSNYFFSKSDETDTSQQKENNYGGNPRNHGAIQSINLGTLPSRNFGSPNSDEENLFASFEFNNQGFSHPRQRINRRKTPNVLFKPRATTAFPNLHSSTEYPSTSTIHSESRNRRKTVQWRKRQPSRKREDTPGFYYSSEDMSTGDQFQISKAKPNEQRRAFSSELIHYVEENTRFPDRFDGGETTYDSSSKSDHNQRIKTEGEDSKMKPENDVSDDESINISNISRRRMNRLKTRRNNLIRRPLRNKNEYNERLPEDFHKYKRYNRRQKHPREHHNRDEEDTENYIDRNFHTTEIENVTPVSGETYFTTRRDETTTNRDRLAFGARIKHRLSGRRKNQNFLKTRRKNVELSNQITEADLDITTSTEQYTHSNFHSGRRGQRFTETKTSPIPRMSEKTEYLPEFDRKDRITYKDRSEHSKYNPTTYLEKQHQSSEEDNFYFRSTELPNRNFLGSLEGADPIVSNLKSAFIERSDSRDVSDVNSKTWTTSVPRRVSREFIKDRINPNNSRNRRRRYRVKPSSDFSPEYRNEQFKDNHKEDYSSTEMSNVDKYQDSYNDNIERSNDDNMRRRMEESRRRKYQPSYDTEAGGRRKAFIKRTRGQSIEYIDEEVHELPQRPQAIIQSFQNADTNNIKSDEIKSINFGEFYSSFNPTIFKRKLNETSTTPLLSQATYPHDSALLSYEPLSLAEPNSLTVNLKEKTEDHESVASDETTRFLKALWAPKEKNVQIDSMFKPSLLENNNINPSISDDEDDVVKELDTIAINLSSNQLHDKKEIDHKTTVKESHETEASLPVSPDKVENVTSSTVSPKEEIEVTDPSVIRITLE